jgi:hypothetical protein
MVEVQIHSAMSIPVELGGGPVGTLDMYACDPAAGTTPEIIAQQAYAGVVASLLGAAAKAEFKGALALIERAKSALVERERPDDQEAFTHLRRAAGSSGRKLSDAADPHHGA